MNKIQQSVLKQQVTSLIQNNKLEEAERSALHLSRLIPKDSEVIQALILISQRLGNNELAVEYCHRLSKMEVTSDLRVRSLETALDTCNQFNLYKLGLVTSRELIKLKPNDQHIVYLSGMFNFRTKFIFQAKFFFNQYLDENADNVQALNFLGLCYSHLGQSQEALTYFEKSLGVEPRNSHTNMISLYCQNNVSDIGEKSVSIAHLEYGALLEKNYKEPNFSERKKKARIRIAYVSSGFYWHSIGYFIKAALEGDERSNFEIFCYSDTSSTDDMTETLRSNCDGWRDTKTLSDQALFDQVIVDKIDILVDLSGYMDGTRLGVFARRAAPIQVAYLGYPNTTGLSRVDYRLVDEWSDTHESDQYYSEKLIRMKSGFLCYYPDKYAPPVSILPSLDSKGICFGSFNAFQKVTSQVIELWSRILVRIEGSTLLIKAGPLHDDEFCNWLYGCFDSNGISQDRIKLQGWTEDKASHLKLYDKVDVHLDTFPYCGTTTTCEALWQGVPTITLAGRSHRERVGLSVLAQVGHEEFVASTPEEYVDIAVSAAGNKKRLQSVRAGLRETMRKSKLMDVEVFSKELAEAYSGMYESYLELVKS